MATVANISYFQVSAPAGNCAYAWKVYVLWQNGSQQTKTYTGEWGGAGSNVKATLDGLGIPDGAPVTIYIDVVAGVDEIGTQVFTYSASSSSGASYTTQGNTINNYLTYNGIVD